MSLSFFTKTANEDKDFTVDWAADLGEDTITTSAWSVEPAGLTITNPEDTHDATTATVWTSGGIPGSSYLLTNTITTVGRRELEQRIVISVEVAGY
jgi:hypothetical protein